MNARWGILVLVVLGAAGWLLSQWRPDSVPDSPAIEVREPKPPGVESREALEDLAQAAKAPEPSPEVDEAGSASASFWVRVEDDQGRRLEGVPVRLAMARRANILERKIVQTAETDVEGRAELRWEVWEQATERPRNSTLEVRVLIDTALPLDAPVELELIEEPAPGEERVLVVPARSSAWLRPIRILVVSAKGQPEEGVPVELKSQSTGTSTSEALINGVSDEGGWVLLSKEKLWERFERLKALELRESYFVTCDLPIANPPRVPVDLEAASQVLRLMLPPLGHVVVELVDHEGSPVTSNGSVALFWRDPNAATTDTRFERASNHIRELEGGQASYRFVGLGLEFQASCGVTDGSSSAGSAQFLGPQRAGETTTATVELGPPLPTVVGRLVTPAGEPIPGDTVVAETWIDPLSPRSAASGPPRPGWKILQTDSNGRFELAVPAEVRADHRRRLRFVEKDTPGGDFRVGGRWAEVEIPAVLTPGERHDVGDLRMIEIPVVIGGRVVDVEGQPIRGAYVTLRFPYGKPGERKWSNSERTSADGDGYFEIRHPWDWDIVQIWGRRTPHHYGSAEDLEVGRTDVELVLEDNREHRKQMGALQGQLLLDPQIPFMSLHVVIRSGGVSRDRSVGPFGLFELPDAQPGDATLEVKTQGMSWVIDRMEGVEVRAGEPVTDERIKAWDLRGKIRAIRLRLLAEDGRPIVNSRLWVQDERGKGGQLKTDDQGRARLWIPETPRHYRLKSEAFGQGEFAWNEPPDAEVTLQPE